MMEVFTLKESFRKVGSLIASSLAMTLLVRDFSPDKSGRPSIFSKRNGRGDFYKMLEVRVKQDESINRALIRFREQCKKEGIQREVKKRLRYEKPSERRHRKKRDLKRQKR